MVSRIILPRQLPIESDGQPLLGQPPNTAPLSSYTPTLTTNTISIYSVTASTTQPRRSSLKILTSGLVTSSARLSSLPTLTSTTALPSQVTRPPSSPSTTSTISETAKIGIGVGVALGTLLVLMLGLFLWRWDRRQTKKMRSEGRTTEQDARIPTEPNPAEHGITYLERKAELDDEQRLHELEAVEMRREVEANERYELVARGRK